MSTTRLAAAAALWLLVFAPVPRGEQPAAKPPQPIPIKDTKPHGEPEIVDLGGGRVKEVTRNAAGQVIRETSFEPPVATTTNVQSVYPDGKPAEVVIVYNAFPDGSGPSELVRYDSSGTPQERETPEPGGTRRERWNPKSKQWEAAPERERWDPYKGGWERVPDNERFNATEGYLERQDPDTGRWRPVDEAESILDEIDPVLVPAAAPAGPLQASARRGHAVAAEARAGLSTTIFSTPRGRLRVNVPDDIAAGDTISGTIYAEPTGKDERELARNLTALRRYVIEWDKQRTPAAMSAPSSGTPFTFAIPSGATTTRLILRDNDGDEVARHDLQVASRLPASAAFEIPKLAEKGNPITIRGPFDGNFSSSTVRIGGETLPKLAESPRKIVAHNTTAQLGPSTCELTEGTQTASGNIRTVGIALSAPRLNLLRGEQTTVTVTVTGLDGLAEPVPLLSQNLSPGIVRMEGGEVQRLSIAPAQTQGGLYTTTRALSSVQTGTFTVTGTVFVAQENLQSKTEADLAVTKTSVAIVPPAGRFRDPDLSATPIAVLYTITVVNNGRNGAENVVVADTLPAPLTEMECLAHATQKDERGTGGAGACDGIGNDRRITFPFLAPGATATIYIKTLVNPSAAPGPMVNTVQVSSLTPDPDPANNRATDTTQIPGTTVTSTPRPPTKPHDVDKPPPQTAADLQVTKTAFPMVVKPGDRLTYTIVVRNAGPDTAVAPLVLDSIPTETTFFTCTSTSGGCRFGVAAGGLVDVVMADLPAGASETLTVVADVKNDVGAGTAIINDAEVSSATPDRNPGNNRDTAIVWVRAPVPLVVISEFRTRGPRGEQDEFIELYNRSNRRLDLSGWTVAVSDGSGVTRPLLTIAPGTLLPARSHLLLTNSSGYSGSVAADQTFTGDIADEGGIALRPLRGIPGDEVGMSNGSAFREGAVLAPLRTNASQSYERRPGGTGGSTVDSNNNRADFRVRTPSDPQNRAGGR
jgi:uncharacterized repeat protein (TIGR01451 family)